MTKEDLDKAKRNAESWLNRSDEDKAYLGAAMREAQANEMAQTMLKLLAYVQQLTEGLCDVARDEVARCCDEAHDIDKDAVRLITRLLATVAQGIKKV
jgi:hypothetical protein